MSEQAEQARVNKLVDKKTAKRSAQAEQEYVRSLLNSKKNDNDSKSNNAPQTQGLFVAILNATSAVLESTASMLSAKKAVTDKSKKVSLCA